MFTVDIDTGGTMTDALVSDGKEIRAFKVDTTPHDYTISFRECLAEAAKQYGYGSVQSFLDNVTLIRWSSTITSNVVGERRGREGRPAGYEWSRARPLWRRKVAGHR